MSKPVFKELRCQVCLHDFTKAEHRQNDACPFCETKLLPMQRAEEGYVHLNWQQLRILCIYATRWAKAFDPSKKGNKDAQQALQNILEHLKQYKPKGAEDLLPDPAVEALATKIGRALKTPKQGRSIPSPYFRKQP